MLHHEHWILIDFVSIVAAADVIFFIDPGNCCSCFGRLFTIFFRQIFRQIFFATDVADFTLFPPQLSWTPMFSNFAATFFFMSFQRGLVFEFHRTIVTAPRFSRGVWNAMLFQFVFCLESGIALRTMVWFMPCKKNRTSNLVVQVHYIKYVHHSSEMRGLCLMKCSSETLQNLPYFWNTKTYVDPP